MLDVLDLFSGIGGFSLGLERTGGFKTVAFCEINDYARRVLAQHWSNVPCYSDIRNLGHTDLKRDDVPHPDVLCGGFPCQDISVAGKGAGINGTRSGLWSDYARLIEEIKPHFVIIENVSVLRSRGLDQVLGQLAAFGYDAEWNCIPASALGAPHQRDRIWIVAYSERAERWSQSSGRENWPDGHDGRREEAASRSANGGSDVAHTSGQLGHRCQNLTRSAGQSEPSNGGGTVNVAHTHRPRLAFGKSFRGDTCEKQSSVIGSGWWASEPDICRVAHGLPSRVDRLTCLGNAIVPQIATLIGHAILASLED